MTKQISQRVFNRDQSWYFERVVEVKSKDKKHLLQVNIRRNAYNDQSHANVKRWNGEEWKTVVSSPITECECKTISYTDNNITATIFDNDAKRLVTEASRIVTA